MKDNNINSFLGKYLLFQYEFFTYEILGKIQGMLDEGKTLEDIKLEFGYLPDSIGYKSLMEEKEEVLKILNKTLLQLLQLASAEKYVHIIGEHIDIKDEDIKKALILKNKNHQSKLIMVH